MRRTKLLMIAVSLMQFGGGLSSVGVPLMAKFRFEADIWALSIIGMAWMLSYTCVCLGMGPFVKWLKPFPTAVFGASVFAVSSVMALFAQSVWHLFVVAIVGGFGAAFFWPMIEGLIAEGAVGHRLNRRMGLFNISWSTADALGAGVGGVLYDIRPSLPFIAAVAAMAALAAVVLRAKRMGVDSNEVLPGRFNGEMLAEHEARETNARYRKGAWVGNFIAAGVNGVVRSVFPGPARDIFKMGESAIGLALGTFSATRTLTFAALREWPNWHYRPKIFLGFNSLILAGMLGIIIAGWLPVSSAAALVFVSMAAAGIGAGMTYYSSIFYAVDTELVAASTTRIHEAVLGAGASVFVLAVGTLNLIVASPMGPFVLSATAVSAGLYISGRYVLAPRPGGNILEVPAEGSYPMASSAQATESSDENHTP